MSLGSAHSVGEYIYEEYFRSTKNDEKRRSSMSVEYTIDAGGVVDASSGEVVLLWIFKDSNTALTEQNEINIKEAYDMWASHGYRVKLWTFQQTSALSGLRELGIDISFIKDHIADEPYLQKVFSEKVPVYLRVDVAKMIVPYFIMKKTYEESWWSRFFGKTNEGPSHCIVSDIDIGGACVGDLKNIVPIQKLNTHGFLVAEDGKGIENWFLIFKNEKGVLRAIEEFFIKQELEYFSSEGVFHNLTLFYHYVQIRRGKRNYYLEDGTKIPPDKVLTHAYNKRDSRRMNLTIYGINTGDRVWGSVPKEACLCVKAPKSKHASNGFDVFDITGFIHDDNREK